MIVVGSTVVAHKLDGTELAWLTCADALRDSHSDGVTFFLAIETDARGLRPFTHVIKRVVDELGGTVWTYHIDKEPGATTDYVITSQERFIRIATGRNLTSECAIVNDATHVLFLDTDTEPPPDALTKLLEVDRGVVFGHVPTYCLNGPRVAGLPGDVRAHWSSAGFVLVQRDVLRVVRWGWDPDAGLTDDPTFARDATLVGAALGHDWSPVTRHDCRGRHHPESIVGLEYRGTDRRLWRHPTVNEPRRAIVQDWCIDGRGGNCGWCAPSCAQLDRERGTECASV